MTRLLWDQVGERRYETGVDHGVLYLPDAGGNYTTGVAWNGLTTITESPSGAESNKQYADNIEYLNLTSAEQFSCTVEAFTYPDEWEECDGSASPTPGVSLGQQSRKRFGLSYRTKIGNDVTDDLGYKIHLVYGGKAAPSEKARTTVNDSPEAMGLSWDVSTSPVEVGTIGGKEYKPSATLTIDSTLVNATALANLEDILYGTAGQDPRLPLPAEVVALFSGTVTEVTPTEPTQTGDVLTIPTVTGVTYYVDGTAVTGSYTMTQDTVVTAEPNPGYKFPPVVDNDWYYQFT